jgi:hypothetical protein
MTLSQSVMAKCFILEKIWDIQENKTQREPSWIFALLGDTAGTFFTSSLCLIYRFFSLRRRLL